MARRKKKKKKAKVMDPSWNLRWKRDEARGRFVYAIENASPGTLLLEEEAYALAPVMQHAQRLCGGCLANVRAVDQTALIPCGTCRTVFCSPQCAASAHHDALCGPLATVLANTKDPTMMTTAILILRAIAGEETHPLTSAAQSGDAGGVAVGKAKKTLLDSLMSNRDKLDPSVESKLRANFGAMFAVPAFAAALEPYGPVEDVIESALQYSGIVNSNAFPLEANLPDRQVFLGMGLFPFAALINHSCTPNAIAVSGSRGTLRVVAIRDILAGDEVTIAYTPVHDPYATRTRALVRQRFFACSCDRCQAKEAGDGPVDTLLCPKCKPVKNMSKLYSRIGAVQNLTRGLLVPQDSPVTSYVCSTCETVLDAQPLQEAVNDLDRRAMEIYGLCRVRRFHDAADLVEEFFQAAEGVIHPAHKLAEKMAMLGTNAAMYMGNLMNYLRYSIMVSEIVRINSGPYDVRLIHKLFHTIGVIRTVMAHKRLPKKAFGVHKKNVGVYGKLAEDQISAVYGPDSPLMAHLRSMLAPSFQAELPPGEQPRITAEDVASGASASSSSSHGHVHADGSACDGSHGGPPNQSQAHPHSHGGGGGHDHGHSHGGGGGHDHGHSHGGQPCHGHN